MANRLSQIATRTGDDGTTGLGDGTRVPKDHLRVQAMGDVDELNSQIGVLLAEPLPDDVRELLVTIQHELFNLGGELCMPGYSLLKEAAVLHLDQALADLGHLELEQLDHQLRGGARQEQLRTANLRAHFIEITAHAVAGTCRLARDHVLARNDRFGVVAEVKDYRAALDAHKARLMAAGLTPAASASPLHADHGFSVKDPDGFGVQICSKEMKA